MNYSKVAEERSKLKFEDTNLANFGTEIEYKIKKEASEKEEAWEGTRDTIGLSVWRIEKFKVKAWPKESYGKFYDGDSYIVLKTSKNNDGTLNFQAYMWIGQFSTQDEYGTAAYKIVELDDYLDRKAVLSREVQNYESKAFIGLFNNRIDIMQGGVETGFTHVEKVTDFPGRLFHIRRNDSVYRISQVPLSINSINNGDCFVLDKCLQIYTFVGESASPYEKFKAAAFVKDIKDERTTIKADTYEINGLSNLDDVHVKTFWELLGGVPTSLPEKEGSVENSSNIKLLRCSDESGEMKTTVESDGKFDKSKLSSDDVFLVDTSNSLIVWVGSKASSNEKRSAFGLGHNYLLKSGKPAYTTITIINEGQENGVLNF